MDALKQSFEKVMEAAKKDQAQVELLVSAGDNLTLKYTDKKLSKFESTQSQMAGLRVLLGASQGYAYTENLETDALLRCYQEALNNAKTVRTDGEPLQLVGNVPGSSDAMNDLFQPEDIPMSAKLKVAERLEQACFEIDPRVQSVPYSGFSEVVSSRRVLNSAGVDKEFKINYYGGYTYPLVKEGESSKTSPESFFARRFSDLDVEAVAKRGVQSVASRLGATKLKTGNYPVVIDRDQFSTVVSMFMGYLSAKELYEKKSLLAGKLGQSVAGSKFTMIDDPFNKLGSGARPFDAEGAPSQKTVLFENGVLKNFLTNLEYARKMNLPHTAHAARGPSSSMDIHPTNLVISKGTKSLQELLKMHPRVVHMTYFNGGLHAGFKESTGDFSMPCEGFLYENGVCVGPIDQFVMSGNILELLRDIEELGNEYGRLGPSVLAPDILIKSLSFAGA